VTPSFRIPPPLRHIMPFREQQDVAVASPGFAGTQPQAPITAKDKRLQAFLSVSFGVLYDWNIETGAIAFTDEIDRLLELPPGGFPRSIEGWLTRIHPDDHEATMEALSHAILDGAPFSCEYRLRHGDGSYVVVSDQGILLTNRAGRATNMIGAMRDVTPERAAQAARREADELRRVLFGLPSPALQVDDAGAYLDANSHALAFFERSRDEILAATVRDDFPAEVAATIASARPGDPPSEIEVACRVGAGTKHLLLGIMPMLIGGRRGCFLLGADITGQKAMQEALARSERALRRQATILDERNAALKVLLEQRVQDQRELEERIVSNVDQLIEPTLERLSRALRHRPERLEVDAVRANLREIVGPFGQRLAQSSASRQPLTRREKEVAGLVRHGRTSAEIAESLHVSTAAVAFHRANIRRKLGIPKGGPQLATHLDSLTRD
jgi:DNA-binding CsgD family transcriptional regulator/PAS domain-containing protein